DQLRAKVESNYAGYLLEVRGSRRRAYDSALVALGAQAAGSEAHHERCLDALLAYTARFEDPHLFRCQSSSLDGTEATRRAANAGRQLDTLAFLDEVSQVDQRRAPIEGIWTDGRLRVAVLPDGDRQSGSFVAVVITPDTVVWPMYSVRARFQRIEEGRYQADLL